MNCNECFHKLSELSWRLDWSSCFCLSAGGGGHHQCQQSGGHRPHGHRAAPDQWDGSGGEPGPEPSEDPRWRARRRGTKRDLHTLSLIKTAFLSWRELWPVPLSVLVQGTVYEKTNAEVEMKKINRQEFWEQAKVKEERRGEWVGKNKDGKGGKKRRYNAHLLQLIRWELPAQGVRCCVFF